MNLTKTLVVCATMISTHTYAADYAAMGIGTKSCAEYAKDYRASPTIMENVYFAWAQGFMSGLNVARSGGYYNMGGKSVALQETELRRWCDEHPLRDYIDSVMDLYKSLPFKPLPQN